MLTGVDEMPGPNTCPSLPLRTHTHTHIKTHSPVIAN
jgi:hypothetical protein